MARSVLEPSGMISREVPGEVNPNFFKGTAVEKQAAEVLNGGAHVC